MPRFFWLTCATNLLHFSFFPPLCSNHPVGDLIAITEAGEKKKCICGRSSLSPQVRIIIYSLGRGSQSSPVRILNWQVAHTHIQIDRSLEPHQLYLMMWPYSPTHVNKLPLLLSLPISWYSPLLPYPIYSHFFLKPFCPIYFGVRESNVFCIWIHFPQYRETVLLEYLLLKPFSASFKSLKPNVKNKEISKSLMQTRGHISSLWL